MADKPKTHLIRGRTSFCKVLGDPVLNYAKDGKEWKTDIEIDEDTVKEVEAMGLGDRVKRKDNYLDGKPFLTFKQKEFKANGEPNQRITVVDAANNRWDQNTLIGNGSTVDVKFVQVDYGKGKKDGMYIRSIRVLDLVPYERQEFPELDEDDEFYEAAEEAAARKKRELEQFNKDFDLVGEDNAKADEDPLDDELPM